jgi:predicted CopG family antitoxin
MQKNIYIKPQDEQAVRDVEYEIRKRGESFSEVVVRLIKQYGRRITK